ncbi:MAG: alpha-keto acid decarboxylase family protein [Actinobacteria bacterium]|nr:alpha-keto acid decarboxylase family protein [Actinomycetota bacterium]
MKNEKSKRGLSVGEYLIQRLSKMGIRHIFGVPGDYVLGFYDMLIKSDIEVVGTTREDCAGFAADAYARVKGLGAVCVTYCVGGLSTTNSIAGAYAEKSPVVVISGAPGMDQRQRNPLLHHRVRDFSTQREVFERITVANTALEDPSRAFEEIDRVLDAAVRYKRPVYIELPQDRVTSVPEPRTTPKSTRPDTDGDTLAEALEEAGQMLRSAKRPVILAGVEMHRFGLQNELAELAEKTGIAVAATLLGKSVISEAHPMYVGIYEGAMGRDTVRQFVERSDCVLMLGAFMTDINLGINTANLHTGQCISASSENVRIRHHCYEDVLLKDFVKGLIASGIKGTKRKRPAVKRGELGKFTLRAKAAIKIDRLYERLNHLLTKDTVIIADIGDALFGAVDLVVRERTEFISPAYYTSMGFAVPAALGAQLARPNLRPIVIVGDGAFQMTGMELSTIAARKLNPIIIVLDNAGYGTERVLWDGPFNDIYAWQYHRITEVLGAGQGFKVQTEGQLEEALKTALAEKKQFSLINVCLDIKDHSRALKRLSGRLGS